MPNHVTPLWLIGAGAMAREYAKVLDAQQKDYTCIGRSEAGCEKFLQTVGHAAEPGGLEALLAKGPRPAQCAIVAVNANQLASTARALLGAGVKRILLEKPAGLNASEVQSVCEVSEQAHADVFVAYNRRFYASVIAGQHMIEEDGGVASFQFEFTEWSHRITELPKPKDELNAWFLANSTHVVDTAFFLGGEPRTMQCLCTGGLSWYPRASVFAGCGRTFGGALFTYAANWTAPGRWGIEILTNKRRLIYRPMEQLSIQKIGSVAIEPVEIDDSLDREFKPGLFLQTRAFLENDVSRMLTIARQAEHMTFYDAMQDGTAYSV